MYLLTWTSYSLGWDMKAHIHMRQHNWGQWVCIRMKGDTWTWETDNKDYNDQRREKNSKKEARGWSLLLLRILEKSSSRRSLLFCSYSLDDRSWIEVTFRLVFLFFFLPLLLHYFLLHVFFSLWFHTQSCSCCTHGLFVCPSRVSMSAGKRFLFPWYPRDTHRVRSCISSPGTVYSLIHTSKSIPKTFHSSSSYVLLDLRVKLETIHSICFLVIIPPSYSYSLFVSFHPSSDVFYPHRVWFYQRFSSSSYSFSLFHRMFQRIIFPFQVWRHSVIGRRLTACNVFFFHWFVVVVWRSSFQVVLTSTLTFFRWEPSGSNNEKPSFRD